MRRSFVLFTAVWLAISLSANEKSLAAGVFQNPLASTGADPWIIQKDGFYYYTHTTGGTIFVRKSSTITGLAVAPNVNVFSPPAPNNQGVWAPELHFIQGKWYLYYAADDGANANHRMYVAEALTSNPQGLYLFKGRIAVPDEDKWAIDGTVLQAGDGSLYFIWSGWPGFVDGLQNLYIAPMSDPWTISGPRVLISSPGYNWEGWIQEGPQVVQRHGKVMIIYSANASWTDSYNLGLLTNTDGNYLNPASWSKYPSPLFRTYADETGAVYGPGHGSFTKSLDGKEDWFVYHAARFSGSGWTRSVRAQPIAWNADDTPFLGTPMATNCPVFAPSAETPALPFQGDSTNGFLRLQIFTGIAGTNLAALTNHASFPHRPGLTRHVAHFESPTNLGNHYGAKLSGYLHPALSTNYIFHISAAGPAQLFLSTNDSPLFKQRIAFEPQSNNWRNWTGTARRPQGENISQPVFLNGGQRYYVEALMKAGGGNDHLSVAWRMAGSPAPTNGSSPVGGTFLSFPDSAPSQTIAYWNFNEGLDGARPLHSNNGTETLDPIFDSSDNGNHLRVHGSLSRPLYGTNVAAPWVSQTGETNSLALAFANNDYLYATNKPINSVFLPAWTIELSVKLNALDRWQGFLVKDGNASSSLPVLVLKFRNDNKRFQIEVVDGSGTPRSVLSTFAPNLGQWYHLAAVNDGTHLSFYARDVSSAFQLQGTTSVSGAWFDNGTGNWVIGRGWFNGAADWSDAVIDEVRVSQVALSPSEFLFSEPRLKLGPAQNRTRLSWPVEASRFVLESTSTLSSNWTQVSANPDQVGNENVVLLPAEGTRFYRLRRP